MHRETCSACGQCDLRLILDLGQIPIADAYTSTPHEAVDRFPLQLMVCGYCYLVQLLQVLPTGLLFGTGYSFYTSASAPLLAYHQAYAEELIRQYPDHAKRRRVVEIGCNDGSFLWHFDQTGNRLLLGVDPAEGPAGVATDMGLDVLQEPFTEALAGDILSHGGPAGMIVANHVLAHVPDVSDVLAGIALLLAPDGVASVEVQYLPDLLVNNAFDLVYHEHRNFFSLTSLESAVQRHGLQIRDAKLTDRQGGSLRVILAKASGSGGSRVDFRRAKEWWLRDLGTYQGLQGRVDRVRSRLWDLLAAETLEGRQIAGYGAPAKATTLLNYCGIGAPTLTHVTDTTLAKQDRYIPGTRLQIMAPGDGNPADTYLLLAWNYARQIMKLHQRDDTPPRDELRWIVPIPAPVLL